MNRFILKILKYFTLISILSFLSIIIYDFFYTTDVDYDDLDYEKFVENDLELDNTDQTNSFNISYDGFNSYYIKNLKKVLSYEKHLGDEYFQDRTIANNSPIIIWWTPFTLDMGSYKTCGKAKKTCFFTNIRKYRIKSNLKAFLFYGSDFYLHDLPLPRKDNEDWGLLHEESPKNNYLFSFENVMNLFNHTSTFKRESDMTLLTQYLTSIDDLESNEFLVSTQDKNKYQKTLNLAPIAYIQSDCVTPSDRDIYVKALMKHIKVDSYGKCLHNKDLPQNLTEAVLSMNSIEFYKIIAKYKFVLAMENAVCDDYVTEKLWRSFYIGSVPIVYGSSRANDIFPDDRSAIEVKNFSTPKQLADYLNYLNSNDTEYDKYLRFKTKNGVKNKYLLDLMSKREWGINNDRVKGSYIDKFECLVCERLHENLLRLNKGEMLLRRHANKTHYGCPKPYTFSNDGILLNDLNDKKWKESSFMTSYELGFIQQKLFFEKYYFNNLTNFTYKSLVQDSLNYHFQVYSKNKDKFELKKK